MHKQLEKRSEESVDVCFVAPEFGRLSQNLEAALTRGGQTSVSTHLFAESEFERKGFVPLTRGIRAAHQVLPLRESIRMRAEKIICALRFDSRKFEKRIMKSVAGVKCRHLVVVKPMLFSEEGFRQLVDQVEASEVTVILWDAIWRTPTVLRAATIADRVFTSEFDDSLQLPTSRYLGLPAERFGAGSFEPSNAEPSNAESSNAEPSNAERNNAERNGTFFACGAWSADRFLAALRLRRHLGQQGMRFRFHLVTSNRVVARLGSLAGFESSALGADDYARAVQACGVLVDLGRTGQSSPSERLRDAEKAKVPLLTTNVALARLGDPVVTTADGILPAVFACKTLLRSSTNQIGALWEENKNVKAVSPTREEWADEVLGRCLARGAA
jgi:hypothetical protein